METKYFAAGTAEEAVTTLQKKASDWFDTVLENNYIEKLRLSWDAYYGAYYGPGHQISWGGEQGEMTNLAVNHYRNIAVTMLNIITANRPSFQARSTNSDAKSEVQTELANGLLEYYMREKRLERFLRNAVESAIVMGTGYVKMEWSSTTGEIIDYFPAEDTVDPDTGEIVPGKPVAIYDGDVVFKNLSAFDVVYDSTKESAEDHDWILCRSFKNKFDLANKYPELKDKILEVRTKTDLEKRRLSKIYEYDKTVDVPVYEFFHKKTESMPNGRYILYLTPEVILEDTILMYRNLPVYRISSGDMLGTPYGYSQMFDLLPIQSAVNSLYSTIMTNQNAFGVQNVLSARGNDVRVNELVGGLNFVEYNVVPNAPNGGKPEPLVLTATSPDTFNFLQMLEKSMETVSGINSVARGNPESSLKSGSALALVQAQATQFVSGLQQNYIQLIEDIGTGLIHLLRDFAAVPRVAAIVGLNNKLKMVDFTGDDLSYINRVIVDVGNPLSQTLGGRVQMAEQLLQMKLVESPEKYFEVMNTGKLSGLYNSQTNEIQYIRRENEYLLNGEFQINALLTDKHSLHIKEHRVVLADPEIKLRDPEVVKRTLDHIQEHIDLLRNTDPNLLQIFGEQPLPPVNGNPIGPQNPENVPQGAEAAQLLQNPEAGGVGAGVNALPQPGASSQKLANPGSILPRPAQPPQE